MNINIFILTENDNYYITEDIYKPVKKSELNNKLSLIKDNSDIDVLGLLPENHYLSRYDYPLTEKYITDILEEYDMILPYDLSVKEENVYKTFVNSAETELVLNKVKECIDNKFLTSFEYVLRQRKLKPCNAIISKSNYYLEFLDWIEEIFAKLNKEGYVGYNEKLLKDILFRTWLVAHEDELLIKEESYIEKNPDIYKNFKNKTNLIYKYIRTIEDRLVETRRQDNFSSTIIDDFVCDDNFDGKIPIWICWWQGIDDLPELVKVCMDSIKRNMPADKTCIRIITLENCGNYVTFNGDIINKFNEGIVSFTHLAEALRAELLYRYGGLWIDATYYLSRPVSEDFFDKEFFTIAFDYPLFGPDISNAKWSTSIWYVKAHNPLMQFITEEIWLYWEHDDKLIDYFIMDYETAIPYNEFPYIKDMIDSCEKSSPKVYELQLRMNQQFTEDEKVKLENDSLFYKLNRRLEYHKTTEEGFLTVYGYMAMEAGIEFETINASKPYIMELKDKSLGADDFEIIRRINPSKILDRRMSLLDAGYISRATIPDMLYGKRIIDAIADDNKSLPIAKAIYDHIYNEAELLNYDDYDLIIK